MSEFRKASKKFPAFNSAHEGFAVIKEEIDELWDEVKKNGSRCPERDENMKKECIQSAAMCIRFLYDLYYRDNGVPEIGSL